MDADGEGGLDALLASLHDEGRLDSSDCFTIDFAQAVAKLKLKGLADPQMALLPLVQSAVAGRAESIWVEAAMGTLQFRVLGPPVGQEQLTHLADYLLAGDESEIAARYLATGLMALLGRKPALLRLDAWDGQRGARISWSGDEESCQILRDTPFGESRLPQTQLRVTLRGKRWGRKWAEIDFVRSHANLSPVPIFLNGERLSPVFGEPKKLTATRLYLPGQYIVAYPALRSPIPPSQRTPMQAGNLGYHLIEGRLERTGRPSDSPDGWLALGPSLSDRLVSLSDLQEPNPPQRSALPLDYYRAVAGIRLGLERNLPVRLIRHGVLLKEVVLDSDIPGLEAVISASGLETDLGGYAVRYSPELVYRLESVGNYGRYLWAVLRSRFSGEDVRVIAANALANRTSGMEYRRF